MTQKEKRKIKNAIARLKFWSIRYGVSGSSFYEDAIKRAEITLFVAICDALSSDPSVQSVMSDQSVSTLESLVPPLDLCKQIPEGYFENSVFVWWTDCYGTMLIKRIDAPYEYGIDAPAPTLQEILLAIDEAGGYCPSCRYQANTWQVDYEDDPISDESMLPVLVDESDPYNPATAALKLWFELNPPEVK